LVGQTCMINEELLKFHVFEQLKDDDPPTHTAIQRLV
jgi:hypothetical protein